MSLYNETTVEKNVKVTTFDRSDQVTVYNPHNGTPSIHYSEETIRRSQIDDGPIEDASQGKKQGVLKEELTVDNLLETFDLRNPETGETVGSTATYQDLQVLLFSLYYHLAIKRDT